MVHKGFCDLVLSDFRFFKVQGDCFKKNGREQFKEHFKGNNQ